MPLHFNAFSVEMKGNQSPKYHPVRDDGTLGDAQDARWKAENIAKRWRDEYIARKPHRADMAEAAWKRYQDRPRKTFEYQYKNTKTGQIVSGTIASDHILEAESQLDEMFAARGNKEGGGSLTYQVQGIKPVGATRQRTNPDTNTGSNITENSPEAAPIVPPKANQAPPIQPPPGAQPQGFTRDDLVENALAGMGLGQRKNASQMPPQQPPTPPASPPAGDMERPMWGDFHSESDLQKIEKFSSTNPFAHEDHRATFSDFHTESELNKINPNPLFGMPPQASQRAVTTNRPAININPFAGARVRGGFGGPQWWANPSAAPPPRNPTPPATTGTTGGGSNPPPTVPAVITLSGGGRPPGTPPLATSARSNVTVSMTVQTVNITANTINMRNQGANRNRAGGSRNSDENSITSFAKGVLGAAGAIGRLVSTVISVNDALYRFANQTLESNRKYAAFSGNLGNFTRLDLNDFSRQRRIAAGTGESTRELIKSMDNMREKMVKFETASQNIQNRLATMVANLFADDKLGHIADSIDSMLSIGVGPFINAVGVGLVDIFMGRGGAKLQKAFEDYTAALVKEGQRKEAEAAKIMNQIAPFDQWLLNMRNNAMPLMRR